MLLNVMNITKYIKDQKILDDISFKLYQKDRVGILGVNGAGKSTLLKIIMGHLACDFGSVELHGNVGYLPQSFTMDEEITVDEFLQNYQMHPEFLKVLKSFKLKDKSTQSFSTLSGGEKTRLYLSRAILSQPQILILDEPTNHLDHEGIQWLEEFISRYEGAVLVVSHDRYFLDKTVTKILELEDRKIKEYSGNYSFYRETKSQEMERQMMEYERYRKEKRKLEEAARKQLERSNRYNHMSQNDFYRGKAAKIAKRSKAILSRASQLEEVQKPKETGKINLIFGNDKQKSSSILVKGDNLKKSYEKDLFQNISFDISKGSRIGILGANGIGKSTLLKAILGQEEIEGNLYISPSTKIGYFSQELTNLNENLTVLEELKTIDQNESNVRTLLGSMLFKAEDVFKNIKDLSLGEKVRIIFLKLTLGEYNLLILDEPTNFLDISSREKIEEILLDYEGAILFVSHDRYFIKKLAQEIWEMEKGQMTRYLGDYDYYVEKKNVHKQSGQVDKEQILLLEMELSNLSFKLFGCKESEKEALEKRYFELAAMLRELKNSK